MASVSFLHGHSRAVFMANIAMLALTATVAGAEAQQADLLLTNGRVYVGDNADDSSLPAFADAVAIKDGAIIFVGNAPAARSFQAVETVDLKGKLVLPGFIDAHVHAASAGVDVNYCSIAGAANLAEAEQIIRGCLAAKPPAAGDWFEVIMFGLVGQHIPIQRWDGLRSDGPLVVYGLDGHTLFANSAALKAAGITAATESPDGGSLDLSQGFFADTAMDLIYDAMPEQTPEQKYASYLAGAAYGMKYLNAVGVTGMREAYATEAQLAAYAQLGRESRITVRSEQSIPIDPRGDAKAEIGKAAELRAKFSGTPFMTVNSIKIFADGVIEYPAHTAALLQPYLDPATGGPTASTGELLFDPATIGAICSEADRQDFDVHTHAIGDGAVHATLDAYEALRRTAAPGSRKLSIVHLELIDPGDFDRFAELDVSANFQFFWAFPEPYTIDATLPYIGDKRHRWLYPAGSLHAAGAPLSAGSDWSVSTPDPMAAIRMAMLRTDPDAAGRYRFDAAATKDASAYLKSYDGRVFDTLYEEERLPVKVVVDAYTIGSARELRMDEAVGSIAVGKRADLIVLNRDVFSVAAAAPDDIDEIRVCRTYFEGGLVYAHDDPGDPLERPPAMGCD
jgi:predicted amidohydrolase YtcJ